MQTRVQQWRNRDTPMMYDVSLLAASDFSAVKCGFYGLECEDADDQKSY